MSNIKREFKYYLIYKTTCIINNKFYIGKHCTDNMNDEYLGSGLILKRSIKKYGRENFNKEILEFCSNETELSKREKEIVNRNLLNHPLILNIKEGGNGGFVSFEASSKGGKMCTLLRKLKNNKPKRIIIKKIKLSIDFVLNSGIDFTKYGWIKELSNLIAYSVQATLRWIKNNMKDFYNEKCYKNKYVKQT